MPVGVVLAVMGMVWLVGAPASAQPAGMGALAEQLMRERVVVLPGAPVTVDDARVRAELQPQDRVLIGPADGLAAYGSPSTQNLIDWTAQAGVRLILFEGMRARWLSVDGVDRPLRTAGTAVRRQYISTGDATNLVLGTASEDEQPPVEATEAQLDQLVVSEDRPGIRLATVPASSPFVDYAAGLASGFPDELVAVVHGRDWLEFAGSGHERATHLRDTSYDDLIAGPRVVDLSDAVLDRVLVVPRPVPDLSEGPHRQSWTFPASELAPLVGGGAVLLVAMVLGIRRLVGGRRGEGRDMLLARAQAYTRIEQLGSVLLETEAPESGANERFATARALFDQARTAAAMTEVARIADEGLDLAGGRP